MTRADGIIEAFAVLVVVIAFVAMFFGVGWVIGSFLNSFIRVW